MPLPLLNNPSYERFAQLVATGQSPAQAYTAVGYQEKTAYTCGPRLLKRVEVRARVDELRQTVARSAVDAVALTRQYVLSELMDNALKAKENQQFSASNRALELLGKELGLFVDRSELGPIWDGDPTTLTDQQLQGIVAHMRRLVEVEKAKRAGNSQVIDIAPEVRSLDTGDCRL